MIRRTISGMILAATTAACMAQAASSNANLQRPMPANWTAEMGTQQPLPTDDAWWTTFSDPTLSRLVNMAEAANYDVRMAARRIEIARQTLASTRSAYFPTVGVSGSWTKGMSSGMTGPVAGHREGYSYFTLGADMSWEIDVFGRIRDQAKGKEAALGASRADYAAAMVSTAAAVATAYFNLRAYEAELAVARQHAASQKKVVGLVEARFEAGLGNKLEVSQALGVYYSTLASIPSLETSVATTRNSLAVLLGCYPAEIDSLTNATDSLPEARRMVQTGVPADLLRRRPDVVAAEMQIDECAAALGVARKEWLPSLTLEGSIGTSAHRADDLFSSQSLTYSIAPTLSWTLFDGLQRVHNIAGAREQLRNAVDNYNLTVLTAYQEADNAIVSYLGSLRDIDALADVVRENDESLRLSVDLYKRGLTAFSNVVDAQVNSLNSRMSEIQAQAQALCALVEIYKALGGGWMSNI